MHKPEQTHKLDTTQNKQRYWRIIKILGHTCARILLSINRPVTDLIRVLNEGMIDLLVKNNPRLTIAEISLQTGIERRQVSAYLKNKEVVAWNKTFINASILGEVKRILQLYYPDGKLPLTGTKHSFESICAQMVPGRYHSRAVLNELVRTGNLSEEDGFVRLVNEKCTPDANSLNFLNMSVWSLEQLGRTIEFNRINTNGTQRNFQRSVYSTQIAPWHVEQLHPLMRELLEKHYKEIEELLASKEDPNIPVGFYPAYGASLFELGRTENNQGTHEETWRQMTFINHCNDRSFPDPDPDPDQ
jgi:hypothetical protein